MAAPLEKLSPEEWAKVQEAFSVCLKLPADEQKSFLEGSESLSARIKVEVLSLLAARERHRTIFEEPFVDRLGAEGFDQTSSSSIGPLPVNQVLLERFQIVEPIGEGGMARVYRAKLFGAQGFQKDVALKLMSGSFSRQPAARAAFEREAKLSSHLSHPNIIQVLDFVAYGEGYLLVMEYIEGCGLGELMRRCRAGRVPFSLEAALWIFWQICSGLEYAHTLRDPETGRSLDIVHRDLSPKNVMVTADGHLKIIDFGIAIAKNRTHQTEQGWIKGTPSYMSPEQAQGKAVDNRSDLFSACVIFYELLAGQDLFRAEGVLPTLKLIAECEVPFEAISELSSPAEIKAILRRGLAGNPEDRYGSAHEILTDLKVFRERHRVFPSEEQVSSLMKLRIPEGQSAVLPPQLPRKSRPTPQKQKKESQTEIVLRKPEKKRGLGMFLAMVLVSAGVAALTATYAPVLKSLLPQGTFPKAVTKLEPPPPAPKPVESPPAAVVSIPSPEPVAVSPTPSPEIVEKVELAPVSPKPAKRQVARRKAVPARRPSEVARPVARQVESIPTPTPIPPGSCSLSVASSPSGSLISINSKLVGKAPAKIVVPCKKSFVLELEIDGYEIFSQELRFTQPDGSIFQVLRKSEQE